MTPLARVPLSQSLRFRLSALITTLIAAVVLVFLFAMDRALTATVLRSGSERAVATSAQMASTIAQNTARGLNELQRMAADPAFADLLRGGGAEARALVERRVRPAVGPGQPPAVLLTAAGECVLEIRGAIAEVNPAARVPLPSGKPAHLGIGELQAANGLVFADIVVTVNEPRDDGPDEANPLGYLVVRRAIQARPNTDALNRLVGSGAIVALGNRTGGVWTDFFHQIAAPPLDTTRSGSGLYTTAGAPHLGAVSVLEGTPWAVWVDFPRALVLTPARTLLRRMILFAIAAMLVSTLVVVWVSGRVLQPIVDLTDASEAIAAGEYSRQVQTARRDEIGRLGAAFNTMSNQVAEAHRELEARVEHRTASLEETRALLELQLRQFAIVNQELEAFTYSVSHDLRAPLRHMTGFAALVERSASSKLTSEERRHLQTITDAANRMGRLIDDLLAFSRAGRGILSKSRVKLDELMRDVRNEMTSEPGGDRVAWQVSPLPDIDADPSMLRLVLVNLLSNAVKYSRPRDNPRVEVGTQPEQLGEVVVYVRDNGVGFDMQYADKLFGVFQRLHGTDEFEGTGIGLANVRRIIHRHGGRTWAEGEPNAGATFYFSLPSS